MYMAKLFSIHLVSKGGKGEERVRKGCGRGEEGVRKGCGRGAEEIRTACAAISVAVVIPLECHTFCLNRTYHVSR